MADLSPEFELKIFHPNRGNLVNWLPAIGLFGLFALAAPGLLLLKSSGWAAALYELVVLGLGSYYAWQAYRTYAFVNSLVKITPTKLVVLDEQEYRELAAVPYAAMTSYKYSSFDGGEELRIARHDAPPLRLRANRKLVEPGDFAGMAWAFEQKIAALGGQVVRREKTFFEKPVATWLLGAFTLFLVAFSGALTYAHAPFSIWVRVVALGGCYLVYLFSWRAAAPRRNAP